MGRTSPRAVGFGRPATGSPPGTSVRRLARRVAAATGQACVVGRLPVARRGARWPLWRSSRPRPAPRCCTRRRRGRARRPGVVTAQRPHPCTPHGSIPHRPGRPPTKPPLCSGPVCPFAGPVLHQARPLRPDPRRPGSSAALIAAACRSRLRSFAGRWRSPGSWRSQVLVPDRVRVFTARATCFGRPPGGAGRGLVVQGACSPGSVTLPPLPLTLEHPALLPAVRGHPCVAVTVLPDGRCATSADHEPGLGAYAARRPLRRVKVGFHGFGPGLPPRPAHLPPEPERPAAGCCVYVASSASPRSTTSRSHAGQLRLHLCFRSASSCCHRDTASSRSAQASPARVHVTRPPSAARWPTSPPTEPPTGPPSAPPRGAGVTSSTSTGAPAADAGLRHGLPLRPPRTSRSTGVRHFPPALPLWRHDLAHRAAQRGQVHDRALGSSPCCWPVGSARLVVLDGDALRPHLAAARGFSREDRAINIRRIGSVAELLARNGSLVLVSAIAPFRDVREQVRAAHAVTGTPYLEVLRSPRPSRSQPTGTSRASTPVSALGEISGLTGVDDPYEVPSRRIWPAHFFAHRPRSGLFTRSFFFSSPCSLFSLIFLLPSSLSLPLLITFSIFLSFPTLLSLLSLSPLISIFLFLFSAHRARASLAERFLPPGRSYRLYYDRTLLTARTSCTEHRHAFASASSRPSS